MKSYLILEINDLIVYVLKVINQQNILQKTYVICPNFILI